MEHEPNQAGGETIWLDVGESLDKLPGTHRALVTPPLQAAFADPQRYFQQLAANSPLRGFRDFLTQLPRYRCALMVATADEMFGKTWTRGAMTWVGTNILIEPGPTARDLIPPGFEVLAGQIRWLHWDEIGCAGGLQHFEDGQSNSILSSIFECTDSRFPAESTSLFGHSSCGDELIYNRNGEAGFMSHETGEAYSLGSIADALNWIFEELRQGRSPNFEYERVQE